MKIITTDLPKYRVVFEHPDDGCRIYDFVVDPEGREPSPFSDDEYDQYHKELISQVWDIYNHYGYWHTMTITAEYTFDGKVYTDIVCKEIGWADIE